MIREYKIIDKERGLARLTLDEERWYIRETEDPKTKVKSHIYLPSCSWISSFYPKGIAYFKWLADKGWNEAEAIKEERGKEGTKVHKAVELLLAGQEVKMDDAILNPKSGLLEPLNVNEYTAVISFVEWWKTLDKPQLLLSEETIWNEKAGYAGTLDMVVKINGVDYLIDLKTSQYIWPSHEIQVAAYGHSFKKVPKLAILQVGYKRNKNGYKFTMIEDKYPLFLAAKQIWENECEGMKPFQKDYPLSVALDVKANVSKGVRPVKEIVEEVTKPKIKKNVRRKRNVGRKSVQKAIPFETQEPQT